MVETQARYPVYFLEGDLPRAYAFAAALEDTQTPKKLDHVDSLDDVFGTWRADEIRRAYLESPLGMRLLFDGMIDHPDEVLDASDLAGFLTHKPHADAVTVRGTMGAFANRMSIRHGRRNRDFPFKHWYVDGGYARYQMPAVVADILRPLRDGVARS
jgi:hypothetical protein